MLEMIKNFIGILRPRPRTVIRDHEAARETTTEHGLDGRDGVADNVVNDAMDDGSTAEPIQSANGREPINKSKRRTKAEEDACAKLWAVYVGEAEKYDGELVASWKDDMSDLVVFVRLSTSHAAH
ncbi:hypothetical protein VKT23_005979 [Stygiomarasmius scandens]|uniref:Uncharacterized protein n=1 Tax=Marasmiellus scandens TaxID=2682957 RepID=A0ABR1JPQ5_9AGAR